MLEIEGFKPYSFSVGTKHDRSFSLDDMKGRITDWVLGECGGTDSPLPADWYDSVSTTQDGAQLNHSGDTRKFSVTRDQIAVINKIAAEEEELQQEAFCIDTSRHLIDGVYDFIQRPYLILFGMVWKYVKSSTKAATRFNHPAAAFLVKRLSQLEFKEGESVSQYSSQIVFRTPMADAKLGVEDYMNVIINLKSEKSSQLWAAHEDSTDIKFEAERTATVSIDVQWIFDPRREFTPNMVDRHYQYCNSVLSPRILEILGGLSFGQTAAQTAKGS